MRARTALAATIAATAMAGVASIASLTGAAAPAAPLLAAPAHGPIALAKGAALPRANATTTSLNWAGYAVTGSGITGVTQSWTVRPAGLTPPGFSSTWAGIGGYSTSDLIQAGTTSDSLPIGGPQYYAWYEILPASETIITSGCRGDNACTVEPGDSFSTDIHQVATNVWSITLVNKGKWTWQSPRISYTSSHSSAEWILEAPTFVAQTTLASVGTQQFRPSDTWTDSRRIRHTIGASHPVSIAMGPGLVNEATPSGLAPDGQSFDVCAFQQTCATP